MEPVDHPLAAQPTRTVVIDDHCFMRELISRKLDAHEGGRFVVVAEGGDVRSAVAACEQFQPHLLILDINLPDGSGIEAVAEVKRRSPGCRVLLCTAYVAPFVSAAGATLKFTLTVNDGFGGTSTDFATVSVTNLNDPPTISGAAASLSTLWPPDHRMVLISITGVVDPNSNATITVTGVTQDEPTNGLGDGDTAIDAIINPDGTVLLRSERSGKGDGRVYRLSFTASDLEGSSSGVVKVVVPKSKKTDVAIDSGLVFDSTR